MDDIYDAQFVKGVFDRCSDRYIAFSWFLSFGFTCATGVSGRKV
jgi:hypothetical protein